MGDQRQHSDRINRALSGFGIVLTLVYGVLVVWAAARNQASFDGMKADEWAGFLAGIFAPLAFLWLVLGFFQQGHELRNSAEALRLQGEELRASVEQQEQLVRVTREQLEFEREQLEAEREDARRRAQPDLALTGGGWRQMAINPMYTQTNLGLLNRGAACTDVRIWVGGEEVAREPFLANGKQVEFNVDLQGGIPEGAYPVEVQFVDSMGYPGKTKIFTEVHNDMADRPYLALPS